MIEDYHSPYKLSDKHISDMNPEKVKAPNLDSAGKFIRSTRIRVARNLKGYALTPGLTRNERIDIEKKVKKYSNKPTIPGYSSLILSCNSEELNKGRICTRIISIQSEFIFFLL